MRIDIPVSVGELLDKITILQIKSEHVKDLYVEKELEYLINIAKEKELYFQSSSYLHKLRTVNQELWKVESELRRLDVEENFCPRFIELARSVYKLNDQRASLKKEVNVMNNSDFREVKVY